MPCGSSAAASTTSATTASRRCSLQPGAARSADQPADPRARRRVEPVPHRPAAGAAAGRRAAGHRDRGRRRADLQALCRDHAEPAGALRHRGASATAGSVSRFRKAAPTARRATSTSKAMRRRPRTSSRSVRSRRPTRRCASTASAPTRSRATSVSSTPPEAMGAQVSSGPGWLEVRRGALPAEGRSRSTATTSPTPR